MKTPDALYGREILLELFPIGAYVKATAFDTKTMTEVAIQGPKTASQNVLKANALKRLEYVLRKNGHIV